MDGTERSVMLNSGIMKQLEVIVGKENVTVLSDEREGHGHGRAGGAISAAIVFPSEIQQISKIMSLAGRENMTVFPEGSGTRRSRYPFNEKTLVLSMRKMDRITDLDPQSLKITLEAGSTLKPFQDALSRENLHFPPYPWCFESSTVGGCAGSGIGGPSSARHGVFKQYVLGMEVVLPSGAVTRMGGQTVKNVVGYDLTSLLCGSEGSLGVIVSMTLRVVPKPPAERLLIMGFKSPVSACHAMRAAMAHGRGPERLSMLDPWLSQKMTESSSHDIPGIENTVILCQVTGLDEVVASDACLFQKVFEKAGGRLLCEVHDPFVAADLWHSQGRCLSSVNDCAPRLMTCDIMAPPSKAPSVMEKIASSAKAHGQPMICGAYYGNGVFHPVIFMGENDSNHRERALAAFKEITRFAVSKGGNWAGPFDNVGIETAKFQEPRDGSGLEMVQGLKTALDPKGIMKPLPLNGALAVSKGLRS